jgi:Na+/melibiose symporter-like transporter
MSPTSDEMGTRTSLYSILCIGIRLGAVILAVTTLASLPSAYNTAMHDLHEDSWLIAALFVGVLLLAFLLWVFPGALARLAAGKASQQMFESPISVSSLQYIAFSVVGLRFFIGGGYGLIWEGVRETIIRHAMRLNEGADVTFHNADFIAAIVAYSFQVIAGICLLLGSRGLVNWLDRTREAALPQAVSAENPVGEKENS